MARHAFNFWDFVGRLNKATEGHNISYEAAGSFYKRQKPDDLSSFWKELRRQLSRSYRWDIWAIGAIVGGQLHVGFLKEYGIWLILQGREFFERVLKDPAQAVERLPSTDPSGHSNFLYLQTAARSVYWRKTDRELPALDEHRVKGPVGRKWSWRTLRRMHPDLWERYFVGRDRRPSLPVFKKVDPSDLVWYAVKPLRDWVDIYDEPAYYLTQMGLLSRFQRALLAMTWWKSESDNGGIAQFFYNSTGVVAPEALEGFRLFGIEGHRAELAAIMKAFPGGAPHREKARRRAQMARRWGKTALIDEEFKPKNLESNLEVKLARFVRAHPAEFFRPAVASSGPQ